MAGIGEALNGMGSLFGGGGKQQIPMGTPGVGDGGIGAPSGGGDPNAAGKLVGAMLGDPGAGGGGGMKEEDVLGMINRQKLGLNASLAGGMGGRNAQNMLEGVVNNSKFRGSNVFNGLLERGEVTPEVMEQMMAARAGEGPGGGFGVTSNVDQFIERNPLDLDIEKKTPFWKKALGKAALGAGALFAIPTGGASLALGTYADRKLSNSGGGRGKFNTGTGKIT